MTMANGGHRAFKKDLVLADGSNDRTFGFGSLAFEIKVNRDGGVNAHISKERKVLRLPFGLSFRPLPSVTVVPVQRLDTLEELGFDEPHNLSQAIMRAAMSYDAARTAFLQLSDSSRPNPSGRDGIHP